MPFVIYFDYETTTVDSVFNDKQMFVINYCQIYTFHRDLDLDKIFRGFQQAEDEIYCLNHFSEEHIKHFDNDTFK